MLTIVSKFIEYSILNCVSISVLRIHSPVFSPTKQLGNQWHVSDVPVLYVIFAIDHGEFECMNTGTVRDKRVVAAQHTHTSVRYIHKEALKSY